MDVRAVTFGIGQYVALVILVIGVSPVLAQEKEDVIPLPLVNPTAIEPPKRQLQPGMLSTREKVDLALENTFGPRAIANRMLLAGLNQWMDKPGEWPQGMEGYGMRFANRYGRLMVRKAITLSTDVAFKTDPRYDRCDCTGFAARTGHAWKRVLVARKDYGGEMINVSRLAGAYVTPMITDQWYPTSLNTWEHKFSSGTWYLGWRGVSNMVKEYWPEIRRTVFRRKN